ncbi:MAG: YncE family protein [Burkholderiales bacterium]|nr:YncE family protein [Bacteroidia bacterium]
MNKKTIIKKATGVTSLLVFFIFLFACTKDSAPPTFGDYPTEIGKIFTYKCATSGCHNTASYKGAADLDLSSYSTLFQGSRNGSPIIPYRSDFSSLCYFINTYSDLGPINVPKMPLNGSALSREEVQTIKNWIDNGATDINGNIMWSDNLKRKKYYVLNQGCDVVTVFDATTQLPIRYITVGNIPGVAESPHMIRLSPDGQYWYVIFVANNIIQKFKASDDSFVSQVSLGSTQNWNTITISDDGKRAYCVSWQANSRLAIVNIENMTLINNVGGGNFTDAHGIALNKTNDTIYITRQTGNYIFKIDTALNGFNEITLDGSGISNQTSSLDPHEIIFSTDGSKYFVTCQKSNEVRVFSTVGDILLQSIPTGLYPSEIIKSATKNKLYITCPDEPNSAPNAKGCVTVIDMNTYQKNNYAVGYQPHGIALDETNGYVIVASRNILTNGPTPHHTGVCGRNGFVNYFKMNTMELLTKKTEVASDPYSVAVRP